jgi:hypothetical protein
MNWAQHMVIQFSFTKKVEVLSLPHFKLLRTRFKKIERACQPVAAMASCSGCPLQKAIDLGFYYLRPV